jgi:hypothetical protein
LATEPVAPATLSKKVKDPIQERIDAILAANPVAPQSEAIDPGVTDGASATCLEPQATSASVAGKLTDHSVMSMDTSNSLLGSGVTSSSDIKNMSLDAQLNASYITTDFDEGDSIDEEVTDLDTSHAKFDPHTSTRQGFAKQLAKIERKCDIKLHRKNKDVDVAVTAMKKAEDKLIEALKKESDAKAANKALVEELKQIKVQLHELAFEDLDEPTKSTDSAKRQGVRRPFIVGGRFASTAELRRKLTAVMGPMVTAKAQKRAIETMYDQLDADNTALEVEFKTKNEEVSNCLQHPLKPKADLRKQFSNLKLQHQTLESESKKKIEDLEKRLAGYADEEAAKDKLIAELQETSKKSAQIEAELKDKVTGLETEVKEKNDELQEVSVNLEPPMKA